MSAYQTVRSFLTTATTHLMVDAPFVIIFLLLIGLVGHPYLTVIPVLFFLVALFSGIWHRKRIEKLASSATQLSNFKTGILVETIEGAEIIKSGQGGWRMLSRWMGAADESRNHEIELRTHDIVSAYRDAWHGAQCSGSLQRRALEQLKRACRSFQAKT
jgi:ATP-binding cassette subfamily C protein LapB